MSFTGQMNPHDVDPRSGIRRNDPKICPERSKAAHVKSQSISYCEPAGLGSPVFTDEHLRLTELPAKPEALELSAIILHEEMNQNTSSRNSSNNWSHIVI